MWGRDCKRDQAIIQITICIAIRKFQQMTSCHYYNNVDLLLYLSYASRLNHVVCTPFLLSLFETSNKNIKKINFVPSC